MLGLIQHYHLECVWCLCMTERITSGRLECFDLVKNVKCTLVQALRLCTGRTTQRGSRGIALPFHDHGTRRGWRVIDTPRAPHPQKRPGTHCTGGRLGPRTGLDRCGKSRPLPGFDPRTVQPVASSYTDYATRPTLRFGVRALYIVFFASRRNEINCQRSGRKLLIHRRGGSSVEMAFYKWRYSVFGEASLYFSSGFLCNSFAWSWPYWPKKGSESL